MWSTEIPCRVWQLELKKAYAYVVGRYDRITITVTAQSEKQEDKMDSQIEDVVDYPNGKESVLKTDDAWWAHCGFESCVHRHIFPSSLIG